MDLPFYIRGTYLPDILAFNKNGKRHVAQFWVDVKAVTSEQKWMLVRASSLHGGKGVKPRPYDAYVNVRLHLPKEHIGGLIKYAPSIKNKIAKEWKQRMPDLKKVKVEVLGFALYDDVYSILRWHRTRLHMKKQKLENNLNKIFGQGKWGYFKRNAWLTDPNTGEKTVRLGSDNCAIALSSLRSGRHWRKLLEMLIKNQPLVGLERKPPKVEQLLRKISKQKPPSWWRRKLGFQ